MLWIPQRMRIQMTAMDRADWDRLEASSPPRCRSAPML